MSAIRHSSDLKNKYSDISAYCHISQAPAFIIQNGLGDLAVMSIEAYERLAGYEVWQDGLRKSIFLPTLKRNSDVQLFR